MRGFDCGQCGGQCDTCRRAERRHRSAWVEASLFQQSLREFAVRALLVIGAGALTVLAFLAFLLVRF